MTQNNHLCVQPCEPRWPYRSCHRNPVEFMTHDCAKVEFFMSVSLFCLLACAYKRLLLALTMQLCSSRIGEIKDVKQQGLKCLNIRLIDH